MHDITLLKEHHNLLLKRVELTLNIPYPEKTTPNNEQAKQLLSTYLKKDPTHIALKKITPVYGKHEAHITAFIYENPQDLILYETIKKKPKKQATQQPPEQPKA